MDAAREHLWGQLLLERNLCARDDVIRLVQERDQAIQRGQDSSIGHLLIQSRRIDPAGFSTLSHEVEGRGRACYPCRRVYLAPRPDDPPACPTCGGTTALRPLAQPVASGSAQAPAAWTGGLPGGTIRFSPADLGMARPSARVAVPVPANGGAGRLGTPSASFPAAAPPGSGGFPVPGSAGYPGRATTGKFQAVGGYPPPAPPPQGSGRFVPVVGNDFDPMGGSFGPTTAPGTPALAHVTAADTPVVAATSEAGEEDNAVNTGELGAGKRFGNYEIMKELGRGGMGVVYKVRAPGKQGFLALKVLLAGEFASPKLMERFRDEAKLAARLRHPNIVAVHDVGDVDGIPFYAMDYIEGSELQDLIRQKNLPARRGVEILVEVCRAAHHAHESGVVHRDLKPSNILIAGSGQSYIMDFGLAKNLEEDKGLTRSGVAIGTPYYMPPEQARGQHREMDARSDVYALGAILYEILTRRVPFTAKTQNELLRKIVEEEPQPPRLVKPGVAADLEIVALKALRKDKADRYESALAMAEDLERWLAGEPIMARPEAFWAAPLRRMRRNKQLTLAIAGAIVVALLAIVVVTALVIRHQEDIAKAAKEKAEAEALAKAEREEQERKTREAAEKKAAEDKKRQDAATAVTQALEALTNVRAASSPQGALEALDRAQRLLGEALTLETQLGVKSRATTYRRALVRRSMCRWDAAKDDLLAAGKDPAFQARANLTRALISLRWDQDTQAASTALREAVAAGGVQDSPEARDEEVAAEAIARAYLAFIQSDEATARRRLTELLNGASLGSMAVEANAALAYLARMTGAVLGGDPQVIDRGMRHAEQAIKGDGWRYEALSDRALLRARAGRHEDALQDLRAARAMCGDGELPDLAEATVKAKKGDLPGMRSALQAARSKGSRSPRVAESVASFAEKIEGAAREPQAPYVPPGNTQQPQQPSEPVVRVTGTSQGTMSFSPRSPVCRFELVVPDDVVAVRIATRGALEDLDIFIKAGAVAPDKNTADHKAFTPENDETLIITRTSRPPLASGSYQVVVRPEGAPANSFRVTAFFTYYKAGDRLPRAWKRSGDLPRITNVSDAPAVNRLIEQTKRGDPEAVAGWRALSQAQRSPTILVLGASTLIESGKPADALELCEEALRAQPDDLRGLFIAASAACRAGRFERGLVLCDKFIAKDQDYLDPPLFRVECLMSLGRKDDARRAAQAVVTIDPDNHFAQIFLGRVELAAGETEAGVARIKRSIEAPDISLDDQRQGIGVLTEGGQAAAAVPLVEHVIERVGTPVLALDVLKAQVLGRAGRYDDAIAFYRQVIAKLAGNPQAAEVVRMCEGEIAELEEKKRTGGAAPAPGGAGAPRTPPRR